MRLLFLDFDGVINHAEWCRCKAAPFDARAVGFVNHVCLEARASIVVSSSWRSAAPGDRRHCLAWLRGLLTGAGLRPGVEVVGATPQWGTVAGRFIVSPDRSSEIRAWLAQRRRCVTSFAVVDDCSDAAIDGRFVQTTFADGLTRAGADALIAILKRDVTAEERASW